MNIIEGLIIYGWVVYAVAVEIALLLIVVRIVHSPKYRILLIIIACILSASLLASCIAHAQFAELYALKHEIDITWKMK